MGRIEREKERKDYDPSFSLQSSVSSSSVMVSKAGHTDALFGRTYKAGAFSIQLRISTFSHIVLNPEMKLDPISEPELLTIGWRSSGSERRVKMIGALMGEVGSGSSYL